MTVRTSTKHRKRKSRSKSRIRQNLQKPNGVIGPRVAKVGGDRFAIVCTDACKAQRLGNGGRAINAASSAD